MPNFEIVFVVVSGILAFLGAGHALLTKRDPRGAAVWLVVCFSFPLVGVLLYWMLGNNRIRTRAKKLQVPAQQCQKTEDGFHRRSSDSDTLPHGQREADYLNLIQLSDAVSSEPLVSGNHSQALFNGEQAYPRMLDAIANAKKYVYLGTYIFESRGVGAAFIEALAAAVERGVEVRVLIDGLGDKYAFPRVTRRLRKRGVTVAHYLPIRFIPPTLRINLRNHRKILVVDGELAFTGGMNIRAKQTEDGAGIRGRIYDIHFRLKGPVVAQLERVFVADWRYCSGEELPESPQTHHELLTPGQQINDGLCRVLVDGPNEDLDRLIWVLVGAISLARRSIKIMTPYFLPSRELLVALQTASLRGVEVTVILPERNNLPFMKWASNHVLPTLLRTGVKIHFFQGPFVHSKLFMVDDYYVQVGSANLDPRSLRLNFEIAVEIYDRELAATLGSHFASSLEQSKQYFESDSRSRPLAGRLRDAFCWLFSPYL